MKNAEPKRPQSGDPDEWEKWAPFKTVEGSTELRPVESLPPKPETPCLRSIPEGPGDAVFVGLVCPLICGLALLSLLAVTMEACG